MDADLAAYVENQSPEAFAGIVRRHIDFVYSVAVRQTRDSALAEDVTQNVFITLAQKGKRLPGDVALGGWLFRTAMHHCQNAVRAASRRQFHESEAACMRHEQTELAEKAWGDLEPVLNEAISRLSRADQAAVVMRYFQGFTCRQVAELLAISEEAARQRLTRAVGRLRTILTEQGVGMTPVLLTACLEQHVLTPAPPALAGAVTGHALTAAAASASSMSGLLVAPWLKLAGVLTAGLAATVVVVPVLTTASNPVSAQASTQPATTQAITADRSTPLGALSAISQAMAHKQTDAIDTYVVADKPLTSAITTMAVRGSIAAARLDRVCRSLYGDVPHFAGWNYRDIEGMDGGTEELFARVAANATPDDIVVEGDRATVYIPAKVFVGSDGKKIPAGGWLNSAIRLRKINGLWCFDLDATLDASITATLAGQNRPLPPAETLALHQKFQAEFAATLTGFAEELEAVGLPDLPSAEAELERRVGKVFGQNKVAGISINVSPRPAPKRTGK